MLHEPAAKMEHDHAASRKSKLGLKFFFFYALVYTGFIVIGVFKPSLMGLKIMFGLNLAIFYGFGLIALAIIMGFLYHFACTRLERKFNNLEAKK